MGSKVHMSSQPSHDITCQVSFLDSPTGDFVGDQDRLLKACARKDATLQLMTGAVQVHRSVERPVDPSALRRIGGSWYRNIPDTPWDCHRTAEKRPGVVGEVNVSIHGSPVECLGTMNHLTGATEVRNNLMYLIIYRVYLESTCNVPEIPTSRTRSLSFFVQTCSHNLAYWVHSFVAGANARGAKLGQTTA